MNVLRDIVEELDRKGYIKRAFNGIVRCGESSIYRKVSVNMKVYSPSF